MSLDIGAELQRLVDEEGARQYAAGAASRQGEIDAREQAHAEEIAEWASDFAALRREYDAYRAAHPDVPTPPPGPEPEPEPPAAGLPPLIGSSSRVEHWAERKTMLEATGGRLEARRVFIPGGLLDNNLVTRLRECVAEGLVPVLSFTTNGFNWAQIAGGSADAAITTAATRIKQVMDGRPIFVTINHEPDKQADAKTVGEGGDGADFGRMLARAADIFRRVYPPAKVGPILNGWWFSAQSRGFTDPQIAYWMSPAQLAKFDFIAADHYAALDESEASLTRIRRQAAWMDRVGFVGPMGIGETNGWTPSDLTGAFGFAKTAERFRGGFVMLWNSQVSNPTPTSWKPVHETGLLDDFQQILRDWRT